MESESTLSSRKSTDKGLEYVLLRQQHGVSFTSVLYKVLKIWDFEIWRAFIIATLLINFVYGTYHFVFYLRFVKNHDLSAFIVLIVCDIFYAIDYVLALIVLFWKRAQMVLVQPPRSRGVMVIDTFLVPPYSIVFTLATNKSDSWWFYILRLTSFVRLFHIFLYFREKSRSAGVNHWVYFVGQYLINTLILHQTLACIWFFMSCPPQSKDCGGWGADYNAQGWSNVDWYTTCLYFALITTTTCGIGNVYPVTTWEKVMAVLAMSVGFFLTTGVFIGALSSQFVAILRRRATIGHHLENVVQHLNSISVDKRTSETIKTYYNILWNKKKGVHFPDDLLLLPAPLRREIYYDINIRPLYRSFIFRNRPEAFLRRVAYIMKHEFYQPKDRIFQRNTAKDKMIYVVTGKLEVLSEEDDKSPIIVLGRKSIFAATSLFLSMPAGTSVRAATYTELQVLYKVDFLKIIQLYPEMFTEIRSGILGRIANAKANISAKNYGLKAGSNMFSAEREHVTTMRLVKDKLKGIIPRDGPCDQYLSLYCISTDRKTNTDNAICFNYTFPWILHPECSMVWFWEILIMFASAFIGLLYPYCIAFLRYFPQWVSIISTFVEFLLLLDIYIICTTAVIEKNRTIKTMRKIVTRRLKQPGFYFDVCSALYLEVFLSAFSSSQRKYNAFKSNRLLKMYRICHFFHKLEHQIENPIFMIRLIKYPVYLLFMGYWFGALLYFSSCYHEVCYEDSWFFTKMVSEYEEQRASPLTQFPVVISTYFSLTCMTALGFGDILPQSTRDYALVYAAVIIGILMFGYCTSELSATIAHQFKAKTDFQENLFSVIRFMEGKKLSASIKNRVVNFLTLHWYYDKGVSLERDNLFFNANKKIKMDILMQERVKAFTSVPALRFATEDLLQTLVSVSKSMIIPPNEVVVYEGGTARELFIIQKGYCIRTFDGEREILGPNDNFGLLSSIFKLTSLSSVITITHTRMLFINEDLFLTTISKFPETRRVMQEIRKVVKVPASLQERRFKSIALDKKQDSKENVKWIEGSFVNVYRFCKRRGEKYGHPFTTTEYLWWTKFVLLPICIHPSGLFIKIWVGFRLATAIITALITPFQQVITPYTRRTDPITFLLDLVAWADLYIMMLVGYYGAENQLIIHPFKTARHYIRGRFLLDVIFCFPIELLILLTSAHDEGHSAFAHRMSPHYFHCIVRILRVGQVYRFLQLLDYIQNDIKRRGDTIQIWKFVPITIFILCVWAAVTMRMTCVFLNIKDLKKSEILGETMAKPKGYRTQPLQELALFCAKHSWIDMSKNFRENTDPLEIYILAIYFALGSLIGCGFGDITAQEVGQAYVTMFMMIMGTLFFGYVYATIAGNKAALDNLVTLNQEMLKDLERFLLAEKVHHSKIEQLISHFEYIWKRTRGAEPNVILSKLHSALHEDAVLSMYEAILREVPLFEGVDGRFFRKIGKELKEKYYRRDEVIFRADDVVDRIFIIYRGKVDIYSSLNDMQAFVGICGIFGNITPHAKTKISVTITALTNVDALYMETKTFYDILQKFPSVKRNLQSTLQTVLDFIIPTSFVEEDEDEDDMETDISDRSSKGTSSFTSSVATRHSDHASSHSESRASFTSAPMTSQRGTFVSLQAAVKLLVLPHNWFRVALLPTSPIYSILNLMCVIIAYFNFIEVTYQFAFQDDRTVFIVLAVVFDLLMIMKIFCDMHKAYENRYGDYILSNKKILKRFFAKKKRRILDLVVNIPFYYLVMLLYLTPANSSAMFYFSLFRMITMLRLVYIIEYFNEKSRQLMVNRLLLKSSFLIIWLTIILHVLSCIWYIIACPGHICLDYSWATIYFQKEKPSRLDFYVTCVYFIVNVFTTTGTGDIVPVVIWEVVYVIIVMVVSKFLIGTFIVEVMSVVTTYAASLENYEYGMAELKDYLTNENVSSYQMHKMWMYVKQLWNRNTGKQAPALLAMLPYTNRCDLMTDIYGHHLRRSYVFIGLEEPFIRQLCGFLQRTVYFTGNYIVQHGDLDKHMYFIHKGEIEILTIHSNLTETIHEILVPGDMFGLAQGLYHAVPHHFSFRARSAVDIIYLSLISWEYLLDFFPKSKETIFKRAEEIYNTN